MPLVTQAGMFAYPLVSPEQTVVSSESAVQTASLQAILPTQSETSRYQLAVMDRDGSNRRVIFPLEGAPGMEPQDGWGVWSPGPLEDTGSYALAVVYQDNLWLVDLSAGVARQVTGDGLVSRVDWK